MNLAEDDKYYSCSSCADEGYTCSSSVTLELSELNIIVENFNDSRRDNCEPSQTDITVHTDLKNGRLDKPLAETNYEDETPNEKELKVDACRVKKSELHVDLEEGEIQDMPHDESAEAYSCRYYQKGFCMYGKDCRFFHLSDKGLYNMFDFPSAVTKNVRCQNQFVQDQKCIYVPPAIHDPESVWDRDLESVWVRIQESKNKASLHREKLSMTIQSGECVDDSPPAKESPLNNRRCQSVVIKVRDSFRGKRVSSYAVTDSKLESNERERPRGATYRHDTRNLERSKTPYHIRWSPKSDTCSSRLRSRSHSFCKKSSCSSSVTSSPKRNRHVKSFRVSKNYRKQYTSSSSESPLFNDVFKQAPRRTNSRNRRSRSHLKNPMSSNYHSLFKTLLARKLENARSRSSRKDIPYRPIPSKHPVTSKSVPLQFRSNRSCSDMSISPLSDYLNLTDDHREGRPVVCYSSDRHISDMIIPSLSDDSSFEWFSGQAEEIVPKSCIKNMNINNIQKRSYKGVKSTKFGPSENTSREISLSASSTASFSSARTQTKRNPLLKDQRKFQGYFKRDGSCKEPKNVQSKTSLSIDASKLAVGLTECNAVGKIIRNTNVNQSKGDVNQRDSSFERFSGRGEGITPKVSSVKNMSVDTVQKRSCKRVELTKSCPFNNTACEISLSASNTSPIPAARRQTKKSNPLLKDLMKFHGYFKKGDSCKEAKNMLSKTPASTNVSKLAVELTTYNTVEKIKNTDVNQSKLSKAEILLRRLEKINAAIERKKIFVPRNALKNT